MSGMGDEGGTKLIRSNWVTTRKEHWCVMCPKPIPVGSEAWFETRVPKEGAIFNVWFHPECAEES
ncbi:MAG: hypothetical protein DRR42_16445 [Gammaproteobacteria bacterium]|nr:MAG: hypothetical protein DRR42_16445 [Gammaproteobacteria bacterium]